MGASGNVIFSQKILSSTSRDNTEVQIRPDGTWEVPKATVVPEPKKRKSNSKKILCSNYTPVDETKVTAIDVDDDLTSTKSLKTATVNNVNDKVPNSIFM